MTALQTSIETLQDLIRFPSVSSASNEAVVDRVSDRLQSLGFEIEKTVYDDNGERKANLIARRDPLASHYGAATGGLAYFCHTDVVPVIDWTGPGGDPFSAVVANERVYGRGSCDMKGSLASMMSAAGRVSVSEQIAPLWIVCTADEEIGFAGARHLVKHSPAYREIVASQPVSIIGEPTSLTVVHAHKGIVGFKITSQGRAAHSSIDQGINANEAMVPLLQTLLEIKRRTVSETKYLDTRFDPPHLSWNFGVSDGCSAINITPGRSVAWVSLRTMPEIDGADLIDVVRQRAESLGLEFQCIKGGKPFWIDPHASCIRMLRELTGSDPKTACYATDGGEFTELKNRVVLGPGDIAQAHTTDEWISVAQIEKGAELYAQAIRRWCG